MGSFGKHSVPGFSAVVGGVGSQKSRDLPCHVSPASDSLSAEAPGSWQGEESHLCFFCQAKPLPYRFHKELKQITRTTGLVEGLLLDWVLHSLLLLLPPQAQLSAEGYKTVPGTT